MLRVAVLLLVAACWSGASTPPPVEPAPVANTQTDAPPLREQEETPMMALERFTNEMCLCATPECATQVSNDLTTWAQGFTRDNPDSSKELSDADQKRAAELATRMGECMMQAMTSTPSAAGSSAPITP